MNDKRDIELPLLSRKGTSRKSGKEYENQTETVIEVTTQKKNANSHFMEFLDGSKRDDKYMPRASFFKWFTFIDIFPFVKKMNNMKTFEVNDVPNPEYRFDVESKMIELDFHWRNQQKLTNPDFMQALIQTFKKDIIQAICLISIDNTLKVFYSIYVGDIIRIITASNIEGARRSDELVYSAIMLSILVTIWLFAKNWALYTSFTNIGRAKLAITGLLYKKLNSTSLTALHEIKLGKVINLIGNDLNDTQGLQMVPAMLTNPYMIVLGTYIMWGYIGPSSLIGLAFLVLVVYVQIWVSNLTEAPRKENKKTTDERVKLTHEVIEGIRLLKMYTWDKLFKKKIEDLRKKEQSTFVQMIRVESLSRNFSSLSVYLNILVVCVAYTLLGGVLSPEIVYVSMLILMYLSTSLVSSHHGRMGLVTFRLVMKRVEEVLTVKDILSTDETIRDDRHTNSEHAQPVKFVNFTGYWGQKTQKPCLSNLNLTFKPGTLTAVIGKVGSGKSSLLLSFLRELPLTTGSLTYSGKIAYVEQDPIIFSGTFRDNILFGKSYNEALYKQVLTECTLDKDLQNFPHGDLTSIGERGVNLSGGQKARVSLARALYSQSDIYLLDDPFSALDSRVAREIFNKVLKKNLASKKVVILVTHHLNFAKESDHVMLMDEGRVEAEGTFMELETMNIPLLNVFKIEAQKKISEDYTKKASLKEETKKEEKQVVAKTGGKENKEEAAQVSWDTYKNYFGTIGNWNALIVISSLYVIPHVLIVYFSRFIGYWAEEQTFYYSNPNNAPGSFENSYYITVSVVTFVVMAILSYYKSIKISEFVINTNSELHQRMLNALVRAKVLFFDINPVGRILNRFSNDLGVLDKPNIRMIFETIENVVSHLALLGTVIVINPVIFLPTVFVVYGLYRTRMFFNKPMVVTKKLELASKSPMLSAVPATLQGLIIIRAYGQGGRFVREFMDMVYNNIKAFAFLIKTTRLFIVSLESQVQVLTLSGVWLFIVITLYYDFGPGLLGLSLMYLLRIGSTSSLMIRQSLEVDINMQSSQRILDYCTISSESADHVPEKDAQVEHEFNGRWPNKGEIVFNNVFLKYRQELDCALKGLSLKIPGGLKIACIGRTGAGKSSIIQALFRMVEIEQGPDYKNSFITIDGVDIHSIGLNLLRNRLSIIPQTPVIFTGTIRRNLDPFGHLTDDRLWRILEEVGLKDHVSALPNQLETDMTVSTSVFSTGQKQLVCLARAIINKSKVIILDEATANVDVETDSFIQKTIMERFKDCTVLTIAHRLITIADYDKVVVIDNGTVAEFDTPYSLLVENIGDSKITRMKGIFSEMVKSTGQGMAKKIFDVARDHYISTRNTQLE